MQKGYPVYLCLLHFVEQIDEHVNINNIPAYIVDIKCMNDI